MARGFVAGSSEYIEVDSSPITSLPFTFGCWWYPTDDSTESEFFFIGDKDAGQSEWVALGSRSDGSDFRARLRTADGGSHIYVWGAIITQDTWNHVAGRLISEADTDVFTGGNKVDGTGKDTSAEFDRVALGGLRDDSPGNYSDGNVAEAAIWNVALTDAEIAVLATGLSPLAVRPQSLVFYCPLIRNNDDDLVGGLALSAGGTPDIVAHPPVYYSFPLQYFVETAAVEGRTTRNTDPQMLGIRAGISRTVNA